MLANTFVDNAKSHGKGTGHNCCCNRIVLIIVLPVHFGVIGILYSAPSGCQVYHIL